MSPEHRHLEAWKELYQIGRAGQVCDEIVRRMLPPPALLAAIKYAQPRGTRGIKFPPCELAVLRHQCLGYSIREIAGLLSKDVETIRSQATMIRNKMQAHDKTTCCVKGFRMEIITSEMLPEFESRHPETLTNKQLNLMRHITKGESYKEISKNLAIPHDSIKNQVRTVFRKLDCKCKTDSAIMVLYMKDLGIV